jgi:hypothetical protein
MTMQQLNKCHTKEAQP